MARKKITPNNTKKKRLKFHSTGRIDRKAGKIPKKMIFALSFFLTSFILLNHQNTQNRKQVLGVQTNLEKQRALTYQWQEIVTQYPNYRDGWIQLSYQYIKNNEIQKAKEALETAKELDPNNEVIIKLEQLIK